MAIYLLNLHPSTEVNGAETLVWRGNNAPTAENPLSAGDTVIVTAQFGTYDANGVAVPITDYYGLSIGACFSTDVNSMEGQLDNRGYAGILRNITTSTTPGAGDFFINAIKYTEPITRGGSTQTLTYQIQMTYHPSTSLQNSINGMTNPMLSIVADYGDPHKGATAVPIEQTT